MLGWKRRKASQIWFTWNPEHEDDPVEVFFNSPRNNMCVVNVNYDRNPFFPEVMEDDRLEDKKAYSLQMYEHVWEGKYLTGDMGEVFKWSWFQEHGYVAPFNGFDKIVHSWDTAYKADQHNDPSACTVWGVKDHKAYLLYMLNERMEYPALRQAVVAMHEKYPASHILIEDKSSGQSLLQELRMNTDLPVIAIKVGAGEDKISRASSCTGMIEAGRVYVPMSAPWLPEYRKQMVRFSFNKELQKKQHDDIVDSTSQFLNWMKNGDDSSYEETIKELYGIA